MELGRDLRATLRDHENRIRNLAHEEAVALDADGLILAAKRGRGRSVNFTDDEAERMRRAAVFTHNHPGGRSFSPTDVALACALEFSELRAVTVEWNYVLRPNPAGWTDDFWRDQLRPIIDRAELEVSDELRRAVQRRRLALDDANLDFLHYMWVRVAEYANLDYDRFTGERTDAY